MLYRILQTDANVEYVNHYKQVSLADRTPRGPTHPLWFCAPRPRASMRVFTRPYTPYRYYVLTPAIRPCSLFSNREELMGISAVWNGFFITASASFDTSATPSQKARGRGDRGRGATSGASAATAATAATVHRGGRLDRGARVFDSMLVGQGEHHVQISYIRFKRSSRPLCGIE